MRVLIVAAAVLACAAAAPSGALLAYGSHYANGLLGHGAPLAVAHGAHLSLGHAAPLALAHAHALPTIPSGDIQGAAINAHVEASDHARATIDVTREYHDQAAELQGQAINAAKDHAWQAVDAAQTAQAQVDGAAAGVAPVVARQLAGHVAPVVGHAAYAAPALVGHGVTAPLLAGHGVAAIGGSHSVSTSSLSQTHPAPLVHAPAAYAGHGVAAYAGHGVAAPLLAGHGVAAIGGSHSVSTSSLSQTHPAPLVHAPATYAGHGVAAPLLAGHGVATIGGSHSVSTSSLSQTHPAPVVHAPVSYAAHGAYGHGLAHGHGW